MSLVIIGGNERMERQYKDLRKTFRSDRGGGTMIVNGGSYESSGVGSPTIYSTADIAVNGANTAKKNGRHSGDRQQVAADGGQLCVFPQRRYRRH